VVVVAHSIIHFSLVFRVPYRRPVLFMEEALDKEKFVEFALAMYS
jgi:hypothetical protein